MIPVMVSSAPGHGSRRKATTGATIPQPSNAESNDARLAAEYGYTHGDALGGSGHLRVTVTPAGVTVDYIRAYLNQPGELAFAYTIP